MRGQNQNGSGLSFNDEHVTRVVRRKSSNNSEEDVPSQTRLTHHSSERLKCRPCEYVSRRKSSKEEEAQVNLVLVYFYPSQEHYSELYLNHPKWPGLMYI